MKLSFSNGHFATRIVADRSRFEKTSVALFPSAANGSNHGKNAPRSVSICVRKPCNGVASTISVNCRLMKKPASRSIRRMFASVTSRGSTCWQPQNFSFWIFKTRNEVIEYFKTARANLKPEGIMVMDMMGGGECYEVGQIDKRKIGKGKAAFQYQWEQAEYNPVNHDCSFYINFKFQDGSKLNRAFEYHWRFWTLPEVREMLEEAGFSKSHVYWELEDADGEDTGEWECREESPSIPCWVCYIVAVK